MTILITAKAKKQITKLPEIIKLAVAQKVRSLATDQDNLQIVKLQGYKDFYRVRVGKYRIVYQKNSQAITIVVVQHRRDVYKGFV